MQVFLKATFKPVELDDVTTSTASMVFTFSNVGHITTDHAIVNHSTQWAADDNGLQ